MARQVVHIPAQRNIANRAVARNTKLRVAAYCRVSTEQDEQLNSFENQVTYYTEFITRNPNYELAGIYADEGISGTSTKRREQFNRMIADCEAGKIDLIITKSISRFARNTQDCLNYSRKLKDLGIGITFERENISTMDSTGELLFTILSSLAQDESRSISENCQWGIRSLFKQGVVHINTNRFYGYDKDEDGRLVINPEQAKVVRWIYESYMDGINPDIIARRLMEQGVPGCMGEPKWTVDTIMGILQNEKHMGDAILQKTFTADYLTKKQVKNEGQLAQYHVKDDHEAIVSKELWEVVQLEIQRRKDYMKRYGLRTMGRNTDEQPFTNRVFCGVCGQLFWRRTLYRLNGSIKAWMCASRCKGKEVKGCINDTLLEADLHKAFVMAWNAMLENREDFLEHWKTQLGDQNPLVVFRAKQFMKLTEKAKQMKELDVTIVSKTLDHCEIKPLGVIDFYFLDGSHIGLVTGE